MGRGGVDRTEEAGLTGLVGGLNTVHADYNNDGDQDIYRLIGGAVEGDLARNVLFENPGHHNS
jgi:hypothetical protein